MNIVHGRRGLPLIKSGGLGDVAGVLPAALGRLGADGRLMMPYYKDRDSRLKQKAFDNVAGPAMLDCDQCLHVRALRV